MGASTLTANSDFVTSPVRNRRKPAVASAVLGTSIFVIAELMFFTGLISAYLVIRAGTGSSWVPPEGIRLPVLTTAFNTLVLFASGACLFFAGQRFAKTETKDQAEGLLFRAVLLGAFFVLFQGYEWVNLIRFGMTMKSGIFGATFFLLIGSHGIHAAAAVIAMLFIFFRLKAGRLRLDQLRAMQVFWAFVVGIWPFLYGLVYFQW
jgi:cytochrome c oxidase subunit III